MLQRGLVQQRRQILYPGDEHLQVIQLVAVLQRAQIIHQRVTDDEVFQMGHVGHKGDVVKFHVSQIQRDHVRAVLQGRHHLVGDPAVAAGNAGDTEIHRVGAACVTLYVHRPDNAYIVKLFVQRVHVLVGDAAV